MTIPSIQSPNPPRLHRSKPLSDQIRDILRDRIRNAYYGVNGRFPSEASLSAEFGASRPTVRTALAGLSAEGLLFRKDGVGTFVTPETHRLEAGLERLESVLAMAARENLKTQVVDLTAEAVEARNTLAERLQVLAGTVVTCVRRTIMVDRRAASYQIDWVLGEFLTPADVNKTFTGSVLDLLQRRQVPPLGMALAEVIAVSADRKLSNLLRVPLRSPILLMSETLFHSNGTVVGCSDNYFAPGQFRFRVIRRKT